MALNITMTVWGTSSLPAYFLPLNTVHKLKGNKAGLIIISRFENISLINNTFECF